VLGSGMSGVAFEQALEQCLSLAMGRLYCGPLKPWPSLHIGIIERIEKSEVLKRFVRMASEARFQTRGGIGRAGAFRSSSSNQSELM
jgi:hypothetical protein